MPWRLHRDQFAFDLLERDARGGTVDPRLVLSNYERVDPTPVEL